MISIEYLAGVLDVSGSLMIAHRKDRAGPTAILLIQNTSRVLPDMFAKMFGGKVTKVTLHKNRERYTWQKRGRDAQAILLQIRPYIKIRDADFDRLLELEIKPVGGQVRLRPRNNSIDIIRRRFDGMGRAA